MVYPVDLPSLYFKKVMSDLDSHSKYLDKKMSSPEYKEFTDFLKANRGKIARRKVTAKAGAGIGWLKKQFIRYGAKQFLKKDS